MLVRLENSVEEAIRLIRDKKELLKRAADKTGVSENNILRMLIPKFEFGRKQQ
jgi:hypothetical protein